MSIFKIFISIVFGFLLIGSIYLYSYIFNSVDEAEFNENEIKVGSLVKHPKFGSGKVTVINLGETDSATSVQVEFDKYGKKWLMLEFANLVIGN